jgi:uncharacterized protein YjbI with pentapeptide repeats
MTARLRSWWQERNHTLVVGIIVLVAILALIFVGYWFHWTWTGFLNRTLWDWLGLLAALAVPVVVGIGAAWFTAQQAKVSDRENTDNQRETALQAYIDKISELLLKEHLGERTEEGKLLAEYEQVRKLARVRTITLLTQLNARRIGYVFTFLRETGLMSTTSNDNVVSLSDADLRAMKWAQADLYEANLYFAVLTKADLRRAYLRRACLSRAILNEADLSGAYLNEADLGGAYLSGTILTKADMTEANFTEANLSYADLRGADLRGANFVGANLGGANLKAARYNRERVRKLDALKRPVIDAQGNPAMIGPTQWPHGFNPQTAGATVDGIDLSPYPF